MTRTRRRAVRTAAAIVAAGLALPLTACGATDTTDGTGGGDTTLDATDTATALETGGDLLVWAWEPTLAAAVDAFEEAHPNVSVTLANVGMGNDHYVALQNALQAGSGIPDIAQIEFLALGQFTIMDALADLAPFGAGALDGTFSPGPWSAVTDGDAVFGLPIDSGPMALFYNADAFEHHGIEVPTTWDEYIEAARAMHAADPNVYFGTDWRDPNLANAIMWQAGGSPYRVNDTTIDLDLEGDQGAAAYASIAQQLIDEGLVSNIQGWTDEWFQAFANGTLVTTVAGGWMPLNLMSGSPGGSGSWRVAPMPQQSAGQNVTAEQGGSSLAVMQASGNQALAYAFLEFITVGDGVAPRLEGGAFPATVADLNSDEFLNREFEYFGGQQINRILSDSAANVPAGWDFLPFQPYANSVFPDTVGQAFIGSGTVTSGLLDWQDRLTSFAQNQGFTIE